MIWFDLTWKGLSWVESVKFAWLENELDFFLHFLFLDKMELGKLEN